MSRATPPSGQDLVIGIGSRLAWDQTTAGDFPNYQFTVYVYGTPIPLSDVRCQRAASSRQYFCTARFPDLPAGRYVVQMSAASGSQESGRSESLTVTVAPPPTPGNTAGSTSTSTLRRPFCIGSGQCYRVRSAAVVSPSTTSPVVIGDGRVFVVEEGVRIRVVAGGHLLREPALTLDPIGDRIVAVALDRGFAGNRFVYVAWIEETAARARMLVIARYRELQNTLGERSVLVPGVPLPAGGDPLMALDDRNCIYVAVPSEGPRRGSLLGFAADGRTPPESGQISPLLREADARPMAMAPDPVGQRMWLAGRDETGAGVLDAAAWNGDGAGRPNSLDKSSGASRMRFGFEIRSVAVVNGTGAESGSRSLLLLDGAGQLHRLPLADGGAPGSPVRLAFDYGSPVRVASEGRQLAALVTPSATAGSPTFLLLSLVPD